MAIYSKARTGNDIINGLATVGGGVAAPQNYDPTQRDVHFTDINSLKMTTNLDGRYHYHGGVGGSGNWEH